MLSRCSFLGTALYGYVALALRAKQWEDWSIMPVTVRGARGGITRALWLRMYAAACPGHACIGTEHSRGHWEGWIHLPNAEGMSRCAAASLAQWLKPLPVLAGVWFDPARVHLQFLNSRNVFD